MRLFPQTSSDSGWGPAFETADWFWKDAVRVLFGWTCICQKGCCVLMQQRNHTECRLWKQAFINEPVSAHVAYFCSKQLILIFLFQNQSNGMPLLFQNVHLTRIVFLTEHTAYWECKNPCCLFQPWVLVSTHGCTDYYFSFWCCFSSTRNGAVITASLTLYRYTAHNSSPMTERCTSSLT